MLKLKTKKKVREKIIINGKKNFLVCFWNNITRQSANINSIKGILFPERIIPIKKMRNKKGIIILKFTFKFLKNNGRTKKVKRENLWTKPPAINSSPKGPDSFLPVATYPKISLPFKNW